MTRWGRQRIESYELLDDPLESTCHVCEGPNCFDKECCRHCGAPLALTFESGLKPPKMLAVVGTRSVGKTVYLGLLADILSRRPGPIQFLARGAFSVSLQHSALAALEEGQFPPPTAVEPRDWKWLYCEVNRTAKRRERTDLIIPDVSGTAVLNEVAQPGSVGIMRPLLSKCAGAMLLVDADRLHQGDDMMDFEAMKLVSYLTAIAPHRRRGWRRRPLAVVFTKADRCPDSLENPREFGRTAAPRLWERCRDQLKDCDFFATSQVGATMEVQVGSRKVPIPLRVEPHGTLLPLEWLIERIRS